MHLESEQTSVGFIKHLSLQTQGVMLYSFLYHGTLIDAHPATKKSNNLFSRKQEGKNMEGNMTPVFTGRVLFWMALLFRLEYLVVIAVLGPFPSST